MDNDKERCANSGMCLCGGSASSLKLENTAIWGYELFEREESYTLVVEAGIIV